VLVPLKLSLRGQYTKTETLVLREAQDRSVRGKEIRGPQVPAAIYASDAIPSTKERETIISHNDPSGKIRNRRSSRNTNEVYTLPNQPVISPGNGIA